MFLLLMSLAFADEPEKEPKVIYKDKTEIDFEAIEIEGDLVKPQGNLILERNRAVFNPLIKLREDFNHELSQSVREIE